MHITSVKLAVARWQDATKRRFRRAAAACIVTALSISGPGALAQEGQVVVDWDPIPLQPYTSWSLFLVCNSDWARPQGTAKIKDLYNQFYAFAEATGPNHLAVWLAAARATPTKIDSTRSVRFCDILKLPRDEGPYVVLTGRYPGAAIAANPDSFVSDLGNHLVLSLNDMSAADTTRLLSSLAAQLAATELQRRPVDSEEFWRVLQDAFQTSDDPLLRKVSVTFKTSYFSTAIAQPSSTLETSLRARGPAVASGATWSARRSDNTPVRLTAFVADQTGLQLDARRNAYAGTFVVALQNLDNPQDRGELQDPVTIAVKAAGASKFKPSPVRMARLSEWMDVEVLVPDPGAPKKYRVSVSAGPQDQGGSVELDVNRPRVALRAVTTNILGWGLGTTQISVASRVYANGVVHLTVDAGSLEPGSVQLDAAGNGVTTLRSDASSKVTVGVDPSLWEAEPLTIKFRAPYVFLAVATLGGLLGAFLRGKGRQAWGKALAIGVATAILLTVGQAVGFTSWIATLLGSQSVANSGEAVTFFLGAIAALTGVSILIPASNRNSRRAPRVPASRN